MRFRLTTVAYVFALTAAGLAAFGGWGLLAAAIVIFVRLTAPHVNWLFFIALITVLAALLLPWFDMGRSASRDVQCSYNLQDVALALQMYHV